MMTRGRLIGSDLLLSQRSYYEASVQRPADAPPLQQALVADVLVVGGGYAGLSAALELAQRGLSVVLLEADRVGSGASGRNGGQALVGFASGQGPFESQLGAGDAQRAWDCSVRAVDLVAQRVADHDIDCDWQRGFVGVADSPRKARALRLESDACQRRGIDVQWAQGAEVASLVDSSRYVAAYRENHSGHLHPLKYALGLARAAKAAGVQIFEHSAVTALERGSTVLARTAQGQVRAGFAVLAGNCLLSQHGPAVAPELTARIMPGGTYIIATEPLGPAQCERLVPGRAAVCDNNFVLDYFRFSADHRLLFGGRVSYTTLTPPDLKGAMVRRMGLVFPALQGAAVEYVWGGFVDISMNRAPDFGRLASNIYYLQGFSGHGVALTGLAGQMVAQAVVGQAAGFDLFARLQHRRFPGGAWLRTPTLALGMLWHRMRDVLG